MRQLDRLPVHVCPGRRVIEVAYAGLLAQSLDLALEVALGVLTVHASRRRKGAPARKAGHGQGLGVAA
jgi:hypothetical protein